MKDALLICAVYNTFKKGSAAIAGGCIRDWELGREVRDIDIIVEFEGEADIREAHILADRLGYSAITYHNHPEYRTRDSNTEAIVKLVHTSKLGIDVIFKTCSVQRAVQDFPCNAVKVYLEETLGGLKTITTPEYLEFCRTKVLHFHEDAPEEYKAKLLGYFPQEQL